MERINISSGTKWESIVGYSRLVKVGSHIYVTGTTATLPDGGHVDGNDPYLQTQQALKNIERALSQVGATMENVVRTRLFVTQIKRDWEAVGKAHSEVFENIRPATTMVEISGLVDDWMLVEVEVDAFLET